MTTWFAVPEDEHGMWAGTPIGADTEQEIREHAAEEWSGKLPRGIEVVIYRGEHVDVLNLPAVGEDKQEPQPQAAEPEPTRCPSTPDLFGQT